MGEYEIRTVIGLEVRQGGGQPSRLRGYAAVFNSQSLDLGGLVEILRPGSSARSFKVTDVFAFVEHDPAQIIGRRSAGTLVIGEDAHGLHVEITPIKTRASEDVIENVRVGHLDAMSFAFRVPPDGDQWDLKATPPRRELLQVNLREVSVVAMPAYPATEVAMRSLEALWSQAGKYPRGRTVAERRAWATAHGR